MSQSGLGAAGAQPVAVRRVALPLSRPVVVYILLGLIILVYLADWLTGGLLLDLGAQLNSDMAQGKHWQLLTAMFLHVTPMHLLFNSWALYSLGRDVEAFYGSARFILIFFLAGLFGGMTSYLLSGSAGELASRLLGQSNVPSAGASGAIFGLVGAQIAFYFRNRQLFGNLSRQQLTNLAGLVGINLVLGVSMAGINNLAHIGGLVGGLAMGLGLAPSFAVKWDADTMEPRLVNENPAVVQAITVVLVAALLLAGISLGDVHQSSSLSKGASDWQRWPVCGRKAT